MIKFSIPYILFLFVIACPIAGYSYSTNINGNNTREKTSYYIQNDSQLLEFNKKSHDTIDYLYLTIHEDLNLDYSFKNVKYLKKLIVNCNNWGAFDSFSASIHNSLEVFEINIKSIGLIPESFSKFINLKELNVKADTSSINTLVLDNFFKVKNLKDFRIDFKSYIQEIRLANNINEFYNLISIGTYNKRENIGIILFDSSFFDSIIINEFYLSASQIKNFTGSSTFAAFSISIDCQNTEEVIYAFNFDNSKHYSKSKFKQSAIYIHNFSRFRSIPIKLLTMNFGYIKLYKAYSLENISNLDFNTTWPLYLHIYGLSAKKQLFAGITQNKRLLITIHLDRIKYSWIKHLDRIGRLELILPNEKKLPWRVRRKIEELKKPTDRRRKIR